jgi:hypothetical protein
MEEFVALDEAPKLGQLEVDGDEAVAKLLELCAPVLDRL